MKKQKVYLGRRGVNHNEGRRNGKFVVPRMLREYYIVRYSLHVANTVLKLRINSTCGAVLGNPGDSDHYGNLLYHRKIIVETLQKHVGITQMREVLESIKPPTTN